MMNHKEIPLVFIGKQNKIKQYYVDKTKELAAARGNTYFIEEMSQEELCAYYKAAKVHVLPSFRESPGLVSLEALYHGCNIVVSNRRYCPTDYYRFDKIAYTCDPYSITSIEKAIIDAYNSAFVPVESGYFDFFSYANAAKLTRDAYIEVLR